jgi:hypothetical protein
VQGCVCFERQPPCADYWRAAAVFRGTVKDISPPFENAQRAISTTTRAVRFSIEQSYRGVEVDEIELIDQISDCEYQFETGKTYFVYAYRNPDHTLETNGCSRTTEISHASDDLAYVRELSEGKARQFISGIVREDGYTPLT